MHRQIVKAALIGGGPDNIYCLGPFAKRVSFSAQQYRAMNLVWALDKAKEFKEGDQVAIVGAGVAGLTAAAAFIAHGCKVDVFEEATESMARQRATDHRMVHPTINVWPHEPLSVTMDLPFLEWHADTCKGIIKNLSDQFDALRGDNRLLTGTRVTDIVEIATDLLKLRTKPSVTPQNQYRLVVLAIGFGVEGHADGFEATDYWTPDGLDKEHTAIARREIIVSGCGDGGLIDALRVLHGEFNKGKLTFATAAALSGTDLATLVAQGETTAREQDNPALLIPVYEAAMDLLYKDARYSKVLKALDDSLHDNLVYLVDDKLDKPYSLWSAPIHKLLIAHAKREGKIRFIRGAVSRCAKTSKIMVGDILFSDLLEPRVVIRHGAAPDFDKLVGSNAIKDLKNQQQTFSDYHAEPAWGANYPIPPLVPQFEEGTEAYFNDKKTLARRAIQAVSQDSDIRVVEDGYEVSWDGGVPPDAPDFLFRIPVKNRAATTIGGLI